jgi:hypothetical protein
LSFEDHFLKSLWETVFRRLWLLGGMLGRLSSCLHCQTKSPQGNIHVSHSVLPHNSARRCWNDSSSKRKETSKELLSLLVYRFLCLKKQLFC